MRNNARMLAVFAGAVAVLSLLGSGAGRLDAKEKEKGPQVSPDDPTLRLYNLLDSKYDGKLDSFYLLGDVFTDPKNPGQPQQHILLVEYSKDRAFGKLRIYVRTVAQLTPAQLKTYTAKEDYGFAENDSAKFTKTDPGPFGKVGDVYIETTPEGAMGTATVTPEVQAEYDRFVSQYIIPALEKKAAEGSGS